VISIQVDIDALNAALARVEGIADAPLAELADGIGRLVQEQTRRRIEDEKTSPDGAPWPPNREGTPILYRTGALSRSVDYVASASGVTVGSGIVYAGVHQAGATIRPRNARALAFRLGDRLVFAKSVTIPARPWLGLSADNREEIVAATEDWLGGLLQ